MFTIQKKFSFRLLCLFAGKKICLINIHDYITVTGCLLRNGRSMEKVTKAVSYSFNVLHVSHASVEGSTGKIDD